MDARRRILIVDDDLSVTAPLAEFLARTGSYEVRVENGPCRVLEQARTWRPHLILMDLTMPGKEGNELAEEIEQDPRLRDIPVVFFTGAVTIRELGRQGRRIGAHRFLAKPIRPAEVLRFLDAQFAPVP